MVDCARQLGHWQEALEFDSDEQIDSGDVDGMDDAEDSSDYPDEGLARGQDEYMDDGFPSLQIIGD